MLEQRTWVEGERNKQIGLLNSHQQFDYIPTTLASFTEPNVSFGSVALILPCPGCGGQDLNLGHPGLRLPPP
jgi:hypothetical protein